MKPKAFSPEPEPVRKPKAKPVARVVKEKPARLSLPDPAPPVSSIVPGTNKLVLNLSALKSYSNTETLKVSRFGIPICACPCFSRKKLRSRVLMFLKLLVRSGLVPGALPFLEADY